MFAYGRKRVILFGLGVFVAASLICAGAPTIEVFGAGRLPQALGAGSGMVIGRAVISDLYEEKDAARMFATVMPIVGVSPSVAPLVGGYLTTYVSWRAPFAMTALTGALTLLVMAARVPENLPPKRRGRHLGATLRGYPRLLTCPLFFGYLAASPLIFQRMGLATVTTSYCYTTVWVAYVAGNLTSRALVRTRAIDRLLWWGHGFFSTGALLMLALQLLGASLGIFTVSRLPAGDLFSLGWYVAGTSLLGIVSFRFFLTPATRQEGAHRILIVNFCRESYGS
ncbi:MFS transporter [Streptomyces roseirectus]|uniref:MFS transporter n=1 Tax=Streptomyces roseirectus TaxID=2768066 RepID=A0A7H0ISQ6_9ACTN|nr:MFS transporter [Streptomyces roseirectus]QNP75822.1 MFS transporter [Streptomyces roseirectus]